MIPKQQPFISIPPPINNITKLVNIHDFRALVVPHYYLNELLPPSQFK
jgi:hypothetical protein